MGNRAGCRGSGIGGMPRVLQAINQQWRQSCAPVIPPGLPPSFIACLLLSRNLGRRGLSLLKLQSRMLEAHRDPSRSITCSRSVLMLKAFCFSPFWKDFDNIRRNCLNNRRGPYCFNSRINPGFDFDCDSLLKLISVPYVV